MILGMIDDRIEKFRSDFRLFTRYIKDHSEFLEDFLEDQCENYCSDIKVINRAGLYKNRIDIWYDVYSCPIGHFYYTFDADKIGNILRIDEIGKRNRISKLKKEIKVLKDRIKSLESEIDNYSKDLDKTEEI